MSVELGAGEELLYARHERVHPPGQPAGERLIFAIIKNAAGGRTTRFGEEIVPRRGFEEFVEAVCDERSHEEPRPGVRAEIGTHYWRKEQKEIPIITIRNQHGLVRMLELALEDFRMQIILHDLTVLANRTPGTTPGGLHIPGGKT